MSSLPLTAIKTAARQPDERVTPRAAQQLCLWLATRRFDWSSPTPTCFMSSFARGLASGTFTTSVECECDAETVTPPTQPQGEASQQIQHCLSPYGAWKWAPRHTHKKKTSGWMKSQSHSQWFLLDGSCKKPIQRSTLGGRSLLITHLGCPSYLSSS